MTEATLNTDYTLSLSYATTTTLQSTGKLQQIKSFAHSYY